MIINPKLKTMNRISVNLQKPIGIFFNTLYEISTNSIINIRSENKTMKLIVFDSLRFTKLHLNKIKSILIPTSTKLTAVKNWRNSLKYITRKTNKAVPVRTAFLFLSLFCFIFLSNLFSL